MAKRFARGGRRGKRGSKAQSNRQDNRTPAETESTSSSDDTGTPAERGRFDQNTPFGSSNGFGQLPRQQNPSSFLSPTAAPPSTQFNGLSGEYSVFDDISLKFPSYQAIPNYHYTGFGPDKHKSKLPSSTPTSSFHFDQLHQTTSNQAQGSPFRAQSNLFGEAKQSNLQNPFSTGFGSAFTPASAPDPGSNIFKSVSQSLASPIAPKSAFGASPAISSFGQSTPAPEFGAGSSTLSIFPTQAPTGPKSGASSSRRPLNVRKFTKAPKHGQSLSSTNPSPVSSSDKPAKMSVTPKIDQFLTEINQIIQVGDTEIKAVRQSNSGKLQQYLPIEPKFAEDYNRIIEEMTTFFRDPIQQQKLQNKCEGFLTKAVDGTWTAFINFIITWFGFIRTVDPRNLLQTYNSLDALVQKANLALTHPSLGILMLPTVIAYAQVLCRLAIGLEKQPELIAEFTQTLGVDEGGGEQITLPERAANTLRSAFSTCLTDKSFVKTPLGTDEEGKPAGKKVGIYKIANICLKILFQCQKSRNAEQIFANIQQQSPPLAIYPKAQQVTYLYYLGRFQFSMNHFHRALLCLDQAYTLLPAAPDFAPKQKRLLLIYLITASIICGRFPSQQLYSRPEAAGLDQIFPPIVKAIKTGDLALFRTVTSIDPTKNLHANWMLRHRILLQLQNRCEILVYRSLARAVFAQFGSEGSQSGERRGAPTLDIAYLVSAAQLLEKRALGMRDGGGVPGVRHTNWSFIEATVPKEARYVDPDFEGLEDEDTEDEDDELLLPDDVEIESILTSLIDQGFLNGWISRGAKSVRVAIRGATQNQMGAILAAGFPDPWSVVQNRMREESGDEVPGWKVAPTAPDGQFGGASGGFGGFGGFGGGSVVRLSGARPAGANPFAG